MRRREQKNHTSADIHEKDTEYLSRCLHTADLACRHYGWQRIPFMKNGLEREADEKNAEIYALILKTLGNYQAPTIV
jgi:dTMP kinase